MAPAKVPAHAGNLQRLTNWGCGSCSGSRVGRGAPDSGSSLARGSPVLVMFKDVSVASLGQNPGREEPQTQAVPLEDVNSPGCFPRMVAGSLALSLTFLSLSFGLLWFARGLRLHCPDSFIPDTPQH